MAVRDGFLLIDLIAAVFLFMTFVCTVMQMEAAIVRMHNEITARIEMIGAFCAAIETPGARMPQAAPQCIVDVAPLGKRFDTMLPLHTITINHRRAAMRCSLEMVAWVYE